MSTDDAAGGQMPDGVDDARRRRLIALLDATNHSHGGVSDDRPGRLVRVCALAVSEAGVSGAGVTVMAGLAGGLAGDRDQVCATGATTRRLERLLTTGEGPCLDAFRDGAPVLLGDLDADPGRWIGFGPEAILAGAAAVFSLPLQVGAVRLGTLDLYRDTAGALEGDRLADALFLAAVATETLLDLAEPTPGQPHETGDGSDSEADTVGWLPGVHAEVHQASGMVSAREGIRVDAALLRIRGYAYAHGEPIEQFARRILDRTLTLDDDLADEPDVVPDDHPDDTPPGPTGLDVETDQ